MTDTPRSIDLSPEAEASRLWDGATVARQAPGDDFVALCEALDLGIHAAEILAIHRLQTVQPDFPATIGVKLHLPTPEVDAFRDGIHVPKVLEFIDVVDLLSEEELDCVSPGMHRGWEDRRFSCRRSRAIAHEAIGTSLSSAQQQDLVLLSAYRNRLFRCPPPVRVMVDDIRNAFGALDHLVQGLLGA